MITINISEETNTIQDMIYALEEITRLIAAGNHSGIFPTFSIEGEEETEEN